MNSHHRLLRRSAGALLAGALGLLLAATVPAGAAPTDTSDYLQYGDSQYGDTAGYEGSYSYVRTLEGSATLIQGETGDRDSLEANQPVLVGDRVWVSPLGRVEIVLSDRNLLRIDGGSEVVFDSLVGSPDRQDTETVLRLAQGNVQLVVTRDFLGEGVPRVDTPNVTVYPRDLGSYRITADGSDWTSVVAREGSAEVVTREGSLLVQTGEEALVEGDLRPRHRVRSASRLDSLELWGQRLDQEARYAAAPYVDDSLRYEAAALDRHGTWVEVDHRYAWRPRVGVEWRPYSSGRWSVSPLGLAWVSYEPWGWVPYHYGSWDYVPGYGWVWFPGYRFAPAWVYWYWTDAYAGWVPVGYYTRHYRPFYGLHFGFRFGIYGWAGGSWDYYGNWTFCSTRYIGSRDQNRHVRRGDRFGHENRYAVPRRGLLTTDTRGISRVALRRSAGIEEMLEARRTGDLPDVTDFVARRRDLPEAVRSRVLVDTAELKGAKSGRARTQVLAIDGIPGSTSARRLRDAVDRAAPGTPDRVTIDRGDAGSSRSTILRKPAAKPDAPAKVVRPDEGFRARPQNEDVVRAIPRASKPEASRPTVDSPRRIETRPAPAPTEAWRNRANEVRKPVVEKPAAKTPERVQPPSGRSASPRAPVVTKSRSKPESPPPAAREVTGSWREGPTNLPAKPIERPEIRRIDPGGKDAWRERKSSPDRYSIPRRVIEGVRSNNPGSTPFKPNRVEPRPAPSRPSSPPARVETRPSSPPPSKARVESRPSPSRPSSPSRVQSQPSRSRPSSPPPRARSAPSRPSSHATRSRSSAASSASKSKPRHKPPTD